MGREIRPERSGFLFGGRGRAEKRARIHPHGRNTCPSQHCGTDAGCDQLPRGQDPRVGSGGDLPEQLYPRERSLERAEFVIEHLAKARSRLQLHSAHQIMVLLDDFLEERLPHSTSGGALDQLLQPIRDPREGRMHDEGSEALVDPRAHDLHDHAPRFGRRDARAPELEHDPWRFRGWLHECRHTSERDSERVPMCGRARLSGFRPTPGTLGDPGTRHSHRRARVSPSVSRWCMAQGFAT